MDSVKKRICWPLEREYEAWIISQMENYLERISTDFDVFAVSPADEKTWPADEAINFEGKIIEIGSKKYFLPARPRPLMKPGGCTTSSKPGGESYGGSSEYSDAK